MALELIELAQLWVATVAGLAGLGALVWGVYDRLRQARLRFKTSWCRLRSWSRIDDHSKTLYGVYVQYTGRQRAASVTIDCELPDWKWRGQFAEKGHVSNSDVEGEELVWLFSVDEEDALSFEFASPYPKGAATEPWDDDFHPFAFPPNSPAASSGLVTVDRYGYRSVDVQTQLEEATIRV